MFSEKGFRNVWFSYGFEASENDTEQIVFVGFRPPSIPRGGSGGDGGSGGSGGGGGLGTPNVLPQAPGKKQQSLFYKLFSQVLAFRGLAFRGLAFRGLGPRG